MQVTLPKATHYNVQVVTVDNNDGILTNTSGITLKNQLREIHSIQDIPDVSEVSVVDGATLVYNASSDLYEVRQFTINDLSLASIDGGSF